MTEPQDPACVPAQKPHSASSVDLYLGCPRRWVFERLYGFVEGDTDQKTFGTERHAELQGWIDKGVLPEHILGKRMLVLYAKHPFPPGRLTDKAEEHFEMEILGVKWHGYTDRRRAGRHPGHRIVGDWKTTKDLKYALKADPKTGLLVDPETGAIKTQPVVYATREYVEGAAEVTLSWAYGQSKEPWATRLVESDVVRSACEDAYGTLHGKALEMNELYRIRPKANDVPYRTGYCNAFNKPCAQTERCNRARGVFISEPLNLDSYEPPKDQQTMQDFISAIKNSAPKTGVEEDDAPPPPPEEDDAPPPPPEEEDDAPPPPPEDDELEAEKLVQEYMASQRKPKAPLPEVEAGFINAPEAKGKRPYATPEEAAIGEGVVVTLDKVDGPGCYSATLPEKYTAADIREIVLSADGAAFVKDVQEVIEGHIGDAKPTKTRKARAKKADKAANFVADPETMARVPVSMVAEPGIVCGYNFNDPQPAYAAFEKAEDIVTLPTVSEMSEEQCVAARAETAGVTQFTAEEAETLVEATADLCLSTIQDDIRAIIRREMKHMLATVGHRLIEVASLPDDGVK